MAETRMAGDELKKDKNYAAREAIAANPEKSEAKLSQVEGYDLEGYSDKDVIMAFKGGTFDDSDYARLTGESDEPEVPVNPPGGGIEPEVDGDPVVPETAPITTGPINIDTGSGNDQTSTVVGNGNTVNQDQDNSFSQYGGGGGKFKDMWMNSYFN